MRPLRCLLVLLIVLLPASLFATTFPVTKTADTNDGVCDPDCSLREAIEAANANPGVDDVPVPAGFYLLTLGQLVVSDDVSIAGVGQTTTIIDGNASDRVFEIQAGVGSEFSDVTIQDGYAARGGGIFASGATLVLTDSTVSGNTASDTGGGIFSRAGDAPYFSPSLTLIRSTVSGNTASITSGIHWRHGYVTLTDSTVSDNDGIGIFSSAICELTNSAVSDNSGGGIIIDRASLHLSHSAVSRNAAGGIDSNVGQVTLINSTVSGNINSSGIFSGGSLGYRVGRLTVINSTVSDNSDGGIYVDEGGFGISNSIVADNSGPVGANCGGFAANNSLGYNLTDDTSCGFTEPSDLIVADAMLGPLQDNGGPTETHDLLPGSPAIDAGSMDCPPPDTDQRGVARPQGTACDIGAVEYLPEPRGSVVVTAGAVFLGLLYRRRKQSPLDPFSRLTQSTRNNSSI